MSFLKLVKNPKIQISFIGGCGALYYYNHINSTRGSSLISNYRQLSLVKQDSSSSGIEIYNNHPFEKNVEAEKLNADRILKQNQEMDNNSDSTNSKTKTISATEKNPKYALHVKLKDIPQNVKKSPNMTQKDIDLTMDCIRKSKMNCNTLRSCVQNRFGETWNCSIDDKAVSDGYITYKNGYMKFVSKDKEITIWNTQT